jgi:hypothetical protein
MIHPDTELGCGILSADRPEARELEQADRRAGSQWTEHSGVYAGCSAAKSRSQTRLSMRVLTHTYMQSAMLGQSPFFGSAVLS